MYNISRSWVEVLNFYVLLFGVVYLEEWMYRSVLSSSWHYLVSSQLYTPAALPLGKASLTHHIRGRVGPMTGLDDIYNNS
jgi:hypothetical protein